jgi:hypothetical protein
MRRSLLAVFFTTLVSLTADATTVAPLSFEQLVAASPVGELLGHGAWLAPAIAANDGLTGAAVIVSHRLTWARPFVLAWAGLWLFVVTLMKLTTVG